MMTRAMMRQLGTHPTCHRRAGLRTALQRALWVVSLGVAAATSAATPEPANEEAHMHTISGRFEVRMTPEPGELDAIGVSRFRLDKRYEGALSAEAQGLMTAHRTPTAGSAGYVAVERVSGTLDGRRGSFVLMHTGLMWGETRQLRIEVIPDSADGDLAGLRGQMGIRIEAGVHYYDFEYSLPDPG